MTVFDLQTRRACAERFGVDPEESYRHLQLEVKVGGPVAQKIMTDVQAASVSLSQRQREVMIDCLNGLTVRESAAHRFLSMATVVEYRKIVVRKVGGRSSSHTALLCLLMGLLDDDLAAAA